MIPLSRVAIRRIAPLGVDRAVAEILDSLSWSTLIPSRGRVVVKLNLNTAEPDKVESANTSPVLVASICRALRERTCDITLVEAHGYRNSAEAAFAASGIYEVASEVGARVVNLSNEHCRDVGNPTLGPLPDILLDADAFVTMPVLKTHALTYFTGALKNQWGCVPRHDRIALHWALDELIVELHRILKPRLCIMDGIVAVEGRGPTNGKPRRLGLVLGSADAVALDVTAMRLVGLDPSRARHVRLAAQAGLGVFDEAHIALDSQAARVMPPFEPAKLDWAVAAMNRLSKYGWFRHGVLEVDPVFRFGKRAVSLLRQVGVVR